MSRRRTSKRAAAARPDAPTPPAPGVSRATVPLIAAGLVLAVLAVYGRTFRFDYLVFDDDVGLFKNPRVLGGLTADGVGWALRTVHLGNWIPVTWVSHMADFSLFGARPGWHHLVNVLIHALNTLLVFFLFLRMTGAAGASGALAALFSLHPLRVESVAWIIERKDVLSALFFLLALWHYALHAERPESRGLRLAVAAAFVLGLAAKPMLVTLPFVMLLLDIWPLRRLRIEGAGALGALRGLLLEKVPLFAIAAIWSVVTVAAQQRGGAIRTLEQLPLLARAANALVSWAGYIGMTLWPSGLAVYYPYDLSIPAWKVAGAGLFLAAVTGLAAWQARRRPWFAVGWLWYVGTLVPVIGLVQVGAMAMADRYTYIPSIGLAIIAVFLPLELARGGQAGWTGSEPREGTRATGIGRGRAGAREGVPESSGEVAAGGTVPGTAGASGGVARGGTVPGAGAAPVLLGALAVLVSLVLAALSWRQVGFWRDSVTLFERAVAVTGDNVLARYNLATGLAQQGRIDEAIAQYREALRIAPSYPEANQNLGLALFNQGKTDEAIGHYLAELARDPDHAEAHCHLGVALAVKGRYDEALSHFQAAVRARADYADAWYDMGLALEQLGRADDAIAAWTRSLALAPANADALHSLGVALAKQGAARGDRELLARAAGALERLLQLEPGYPNAREELLAIRRRLQDPSGR